jgi:ribonucleotide reductase alpha subunit
MEWRTFLSLLNVMLGACSRNNDKLRARNEASRAQQKGRSTPVPTIELFERAFEPPSSVAAQKALLQQPQDL